MEAARRRVIRDGIAVGLATGAYGLSFGAVSVAAGLSVLQTSALSLLMFTGASQFAFVSLIGSGGFAAASTAVLLGARNAFYGIRLSQLLDLQGVSRFVGAQLVIDESTAMAVGVPPDLARVGFVATGLGVFVCWNLGTLVGAVGLGAVSNPSALGLDAAAPAAFLALLAPRLRGRSVWWLAIVAAAVATVAVPVTPAWAPVLVAAAVAIGWSWRSAGGSGA